MQPETRFAAVGSDRVAYQVLGHGPRDIVYTTGFWNHLDIEWEEPGLARFYRRLASLGRLVRFDCRGTGLSDQRPADGLSDLEHWLQDCDAVLNAVRVREAVFFAETTADVGPLVLHYVDRYPNRCSALVFANTGACPLARPDYPEGMTDDVRRQLQEEIRRIYGTAEMSDWFVPSRARDDGFRLWFAKLMRAMASPRAVVENLEDWDHLDCRHLLGRVRVPTLVMASAGFQIPPPAQGRYLAQHIAGARYVELPGADAMCWLVPHAVDLVEEFITGQRARGATERAIVTVLFTDIVGSTSRAAQLGNAAWRALLDRHDRIVREQIGLHCGRFIESAGDGTIATFEHPGSAIECGHALHRALAPLALSIRAGVHTGEVQLRDDGRLGGIAVHLAARVLALAAAGEVLASSTVQGVLLGSAFRFEERGVHELKGVPGCWPLFAVTTTA